MMKKLFFLFFLMFTAVLLAQERTMIQGTISVPPGDDPTGITIFNETSKKGTVSTSGGNFSIAVAPGDRLVFSAVQFEDFTVIVGEEIIDSGVLNVRISEAINQLEEVVVSTTGLSGVIEIDVNRVPLGVIELPESAAEINPVKWEFKPDPLTSPRNAAMDLEYLQHGIKFINIFKAIFSESQQEEANRKRIDEKIRELYDDEFFQKYLDIEYENINDFIFFAESNGLREILLQPEHELDLIAFLIEQSEKYKKQED